MTITVADFVNVKERAADLSCIEPKGLEVLPPNFLRRRVVWSYFICPKRRLCGLYSKLAEFLHIIYCPKANVLATSTTTASASSRRGTVAYPKPTSPTSIATCSPSKPAATPYQAMGGGGASSSTVPALPTGEMVGSVQAFAASKNPPKDQSDRAQIVANMPQAQCEKLAVLDILTLNRDRHAGNIIVAAGGQSFIPVDHGLTSPAETPSAAAPSIPLSTTHPNLCRQFNPSAVNVLICDLRREGEPIFDILNSRGWHQFPKFKDRSYQLFHCWLLEHASTLLETYRNKTTRPDSSPVRIGTLPLLT